MNFIIANIWILNFDSEGYVYQLKIFKKNVSERICILTWTKMITELRDYKHLS